MPSVVIPFAGSCPYRQRALAWVAARYAEVHPGWGVIPSEWRLPAPFRKGSVVNAGIAVAPTQTVVVADADVWCDGLAKAIEAVKDGAPWAVPHRRVHRLSRGGTEAVLEGQPWHAQPLSQPAYEGMQGGGYVVARRELLLEIPMDENFTGWGQEDQSWAMALHHLAGEAWRGTADLIHLWHPEPERLDRKRGSVENWNRFRLYCKAREDPAKMRELVEGRA